MIYLVASLTSYYRLTICPSSNECISMKLVVIN